MLYKSIINVVGVVAVAAVVSIGCNEKPDDDGGNTDGSVTYGGKTYKIVKIDSQTWFAENLNYDVPGVTTDVCYENSADNCTKYGRLYNWNTALTVCPAGWHLPSDAEWTTLTDYVGGSSTAGKKLKSTSGWYNNGNGTNQYGFSALPGGAGGGGGDFYVAGNFGYWWSATENDADSAIYRLIHDNLDGVRSDYHDKNSQFSVRCVQDN